MFVSYPIAHVRTIEFIETTAHIPVSGYVKLRLDAFLKMFPYGHHRDLVHKYAICVPQLACYPYTFWVTTIYLTWGLDEITMSVVYGAGAPSLRRLGTWSFSGVFLSFVYVPSLWRSTSSTVVLHGICQMLIDSFIPKWFEGLVSVVDIFHSLTMPGKLPWHAGCSYNYIVDI